RKAHGTAIGIERCGLRLSLTTEHILPGRMSSPSTAPYLHSGELPLSLPATTLVLHQFRCNSKASGDAATTAAHITATVRSARSPAAVPRGLPDGRRALC